MGGALTSDAFRVSAPDPSGAGAGAAMRQALRASGTAPGDVDHIRAHGTSTRINGRTETLAIRQVYGPHAYDLAVSSPKSMVGHLIGAVGALSAMVCASAIRDGTVPPRHPRNSTELPPERPHFGLSVGHLSSGADHQLSTPGPVPGIPRAAAPSGRIPGGNLASY
ncbi:hypothetical protein ABZY09_00095 [Streptomyces sp. NPDC002928]|uniref:hypothetical protein n=1 Tax=Streptomyces sp. NPDC002928 TaxID=3154440 RepID=UPI0033AD7A70